VKKEQPTQSGSPRYLIQRAAPPANGVVLKAST
jgi:hypothetical protein